MYKGFINHSQEALQFHIAVVGTCSASDNGGIKGGDYYEKEEFNKMTPDQMKKLPELYKKCRAGEDGNSGKWSI